MNLVKQRGAKHLVFLCSLILRTHYIIVFVICQADYIFKTELYLLALAVFNANVAVLTYSPRLKPGDSRIRTNLADI
jgi:hypothetical protein